MADIRVLVADDDRFTRQFLVTLLEKWGYKVVTAADGIQARQELDKDSSIEMALLDWNMPGKTGISLISDIKQKNPNRILNTILITGNNEKKHMLEAIESGADDFISKPIDIELLKVRLLAAKRTILAQRHLMERNQSLDREVQRRTEDLQQAVAEATRASEMKSNFLANMSHEIRTPLNGIVSYIELLLLSQLNEEQKNDLLIIRSCSHSLRTIIDDVLDFSKIEAGRMMIEKAPFDITGATEEIIDLLCIQAKDKNLRLAFSPGILPPQVWGDRIRYQQVLTNLLSNAIKFSTTGGEITIAIQAVHDAIHLMVTDQGIGIPISKQRSIFESFTQSDSSTTRKFGGTGLGLTIVKKLTELMGGHIWLDSTEGVGSSFHILLPLAPSDGVPVSTELDFKIEKCFSGLSVLVAEDNIVNQQALRRILEIAGCQVQTVGNGIQALEAINEHAFSLLFLDLQMPLMGGEETARRVREKEKLHSDILPLPIIALTANIVGGNRDRHHEAGIDEVLTKPLSYVELFKTIQRYVSPMMRVE